MLLNTGKRWFICLVLAACLLSAIPAAAADLYDQQNEIQARINNLILLPFPFVWSNPVEGWYWEVMAVSPRLAQNGQDLFLLGRYSPSLKHGSWGASYQQRFGNRGKWGVMAWDMVTFQGMYGTLPLWTNSEGAQLLVRLPLGESFTLDSALTRTNTSRALYHGSLPVDGGVVAELNHSLSFSPTPDTSAYLLWTHGVNWFDGQYPFNMVEAGGMKAFSLGEDRTLTLWGKASALGGDYPRENALSLGDERFNFDGNMGTYIQGAGNNLFLGSSSNLPYLRGYEPGTFLGDRLYVFNVEYAKTLLESGSIKLEAVTFVDGGDAWYQGDQPGPVNLSVGAGLRLHVPLETPTDMGLFSNRFGGMMSLDVARGLSQKGAWKVGISYGISYVF